MAGREGIGAELRALRLAAGLSMVEAARRAGVTRVTLHRWEVNDSAPERAGLDRLLSGLNADPRARARLLTAGKPLRAAPELASTPLGAPAHPGLIFKTLRTRKGLSQSDLARAVGTTQGTVARWEAGSRMPGGEFLARVLAALGASAAEAGWLREDAPDRYAPVRTIEEARARLRPLSGYDAPIAALIALEREVWERAARDPRWEGTLAEVASARSTAHAYAGEPDASLDAANRALRLARSSGEWRVNGAIRTIVRTRQERGVHPVELGRMWAEYAEKTAAHEDHYLIYELWAQFEHLFDAEGAERLLFRAMEGSPGDEPPDPDDCSEVNTVVYRSGAWASLAEVRFRHGDLEGALTALGQTACYRKEGHVQWCTTLDWCLATLRRAGERPWPSLVASFERHRRRPNLTRWERSLLAKHEAWLGPLPASGRKEPTSA